MGLLNECKGNNSNTKETKNKMREKERERESREFVPDKNEDLNGIESSDSKD